MLRTFTSLLRVVARSATTAVFVALLVSAPATAQAPADGQPKAGGTVRIGAWPEPPTLNPYFASSSNVIFEELTLDGLSRGGPDGSYLPVLAAEVPTQANGDVSPDGTVVTWKLKPGVTWSDGQPFTSQDVVFTYQMIMDPAIWYQSHRLRGHGLRNRARRQHGRHHLQNRGGPARRYEVARYLH